MVLIYELSHSFIVIKHGIRSAGVGALQRAGGLPPSMYKKKNCEKKLRKKIKCKQNYFTWKRF